MVKKIIVHRKGFTFKKGRAKGKRVKPSTFKIKDRGAPGRAKKVIPPLKKGGLGITFKMPERKAKSILVKKTKSVGEKKIVSRLIALEVLTKRTNPKVSKKAKKYAHWVAGSFKGKKKVNYPKGFA